MNRGLKQQLYNGFYWQFSVVILQSFVQFGVLFILARLISPNDFGIAQSALIVVGFANLLSQIGIGPAIVQRSVLTENHIRAGSTLSITFGFFLSFLVFTFNTYIASFFNMPSLARILKFVSIIFIVESITIISQSLLQREMKLKALAIIDLISYSFYGIVAITLGLLGHGVWALIWGAISQAFIKNIILQIIKPHSILPFLRKKEAMDLLYFGGGFTIARFLNYFANQGDNIITGKYLGADSLGIYSRAYAIMVKPVSLIGNSIDKVLFPAMAARQSNPDKLIDAFINGSKLITFLCIPFSIAIIISSNEIIHVLFGSAWIRAQIPLQILTLGLVFRMGYKMGDILTKATGYVYSRAKRNMIYALSVLIGCYLGTNWGIIGVSCGTLLAIILNYILMIDLSLKVLKISWVFFFKKIFQELFITILLGLLFIIIINLTRFLFVSNFLILFVTYTIYGLTCVILFYFFGHKLSFINILPLEGKLKNYIRKS